METVRNLHQMENLRKGNGKFMTGPTVAKVIRDASLIKDLASYVIVIDEHGNVKYHYSNPPFTDTLDCIAVLAPAELHGVRIEQAVALEIGISRFVPWNNTEFISSETGKKRIISRRTCLGILPWDVVLKILPLLWTMIQHAVDSRMENWTRSRFIQGKEESRKSFSVFESWMTIRIPKEYPLLYTILRLKDEEDRLLPGKNYAHVAENIQREFDIFFNLNQQKHNEYYDELVKKSSTVRTVAKKIEKNITYRGYTQRSIAQIRKLLVSKHKKYLDLFDQMCRVFSVKKAVPDDFLDVHEVLLGIGTTELLSSCPLRPCLVYKYEKRRVVHAKDSFSIGIFGSPEHMKKLDIRNTSNRLASLTSNNSNEDDYVPF